MKGIWLFLNLTAPGVAKLTSLLQSAFGIRPFGCFPLRPAHLHKTVPSLRASSRSPGGSRSPNVSSIHMRTSFAALGVYLSMRSLRMSWSSEVTDAMTGESGANQGLGVGGFGGGGWARKAAGGRGEEVTRQAGWNRCTM